MKKRCVLAGAACALVAVSLALPSARAEESALQQMELFRAQLEMFSGSGAPAR